MVVAVTLSETSAFLASGGETSALAVLVHGLDDPVDAGVLADDLVLRVDEDDFEVLVGRVLVDPVGVEDAKVGAAATDSLFGGGLQGALVFELVNTLVGGFAWEMLEGYRSHFIGIPHTVGSTLGRRPLATTSADSYTVDDITLLSLVAETAGLVWSGWARSTMNDMKLSELY